MTENYCNIISVVILLFQALFWILHVVCVLNFGLMFYRCIAGVDFTIDYVDDDDADSSPVSQQVEMANAGTQTSEMPI